MLTRAKLAAAVQAAVLVPVLSLPTTTGPSLAAAPSDVTPVAPPNATRYVPPVPGQVARGFDPPEHEWQAGHRGVDLWSARGDAVVSPGTGVVTFAGSVGGKPVVVVTHPDGLRSSLEPVDATVPRGTAVRAGDPVGVLAAAPGGASNPDHCAALAPAVDGAACAHWGVRRGGTYLDPLTLLGTAPPIVLLPPA
ncbi:Peptidase M23 [Xylanimonas cellulosilytica DSM 15894]|uniref:Peptidase M23 n=1 Tax=Xylanimonas cellulosilytica (strain DSM 15894 / JCM 12276 / CECT 5975 / KCTC 9989 / LMG 20990 / NBRC 107835 / XIL07) TaxID=446471 RepID=D1C021_XYLCX|nr:peptidoglycan DD-metalloendopeptidase family protein [Xylanimonas cellulosilytica]ACZ30210.1 Peptidase M23 [Xylanimonas cellulosilytica DSM 15894]